MPKRTSRKLSSEELEEIADKIIEGKISIRGAATQYEISRSTLSRDLETLKESNPEKYKKLESKNEKNNRSGGKIEGPNDEIYGKPEEIKAFYLTYLIYAKEVESDKEIIEKMQMPKATFYRKKKAFNVYLQRGEIKFAKEQFAVMPDKIKEEILVHKLRDRYRSLGKKVISKDECKTRIDKFMKYILEERNGQTETGIEKEDIYSIIHDNIDLIRLSLEEKIKPNMENLDKIIGKQMTNTILTSKPFMFSFARERIEELIEIANSHGKLNEYAKSSDRSSPELLHAILEFAADENIDFKHINQIMKVARARRITNKYLLARYPYKSRGNRNSGVEIN